MRIVALDRELTRSNNPRNPGVMASKGMSFQMMPADSIQAVLTPSGYK